MGEWCGDSSQVRTQQLLIRERQWLATQKGLLSQGRTLLVFDGDMSLPEWVESLVRKFGRVLIHGRCSGLLALAGFLRASALEVDSELSLLVGEASTVLARARSIRRCRSFPPGWLLGGVGPAASVGDVKAIQNLYLASGLAPLPGGFIRGEGSQAHTFVLRDTNRTIVGCATVQDLSDAGDRYRGAAMVLSVCLRPDVRGHGLSPLLNAAALTYGIREYRARRVYEIVEGGNFLSLRMNESCGLVPHETEGFIFVIAPS